MNSRLLIRIDQAFTVIESLSLQYIDRVLKGYIYPVFKGIKNRYKGFRFKGKAEKDNRFLPPDFYYVKCNPIQLPKPSKLVTSPPSTADPLDPFNYIRFTAKRERRMDTAPRPRRFRKPPLENAVHFLSYREFCSQLWLENGSPRHDAPRWALRWDGPVVIDGERTVGHIRIDVSDIKQADELHHAISPAYETARQRAYALYLDKWGPIKKPSLHDIEYAHAKEVLAQRSDPGTCTYRGVRLGQFTKAELIKIATEGWEKYSKSLQERLNRGLRG